MVGCLYWLLLVVFLLILLFAFCVLVGVGAFLWFGLILVGGSMSICCLRVIVICCLIITLIVLYIDILFCCLFLFICSDCLVWCGCIV